MICTPVFFWFLVFVSGSAISLGWSCLSSITGTDTPRFTLEGPPRSTLVLFRGWPPTWLSSTSSSNGEGVCWRAVFSFWTSVMWWCCVALLSHSCEPRVGLACPFWDKSEFLAWLPCSLWGLQRLLDPSLRTWSTWGNSRGCVRKNINRPHGGRQMLYRRGTPNFAASSLILPETPLLTWASEYLL